MSAEGAHDSRVRLRDNPFYVLELAPDASRAEVERAGQKLLAMLEIGLSGATTFPTPFGHSRRDAALVREATAELRDPQRRLLHELWVLAQPWQAGAGPEWSLEPGQDLDRNVDPDLGRDSDEISAGFAQANNTLGWR